MDNKSKKTISSESDKKRSFEKALRSLGYLFPETEEEIKNLEEIIGSTNIPLPESLKDASFLFAEKKEANIVPLFTKTEEYSKLLYAGQKKPNTSFSKSAKDLKKKSEKNKKK